MPIPDDELDIIKHANLKSIMLGEIGKLFPAAAE